MNCNRLILFALSLFFMGCMTQMKVLEVIPSVETQVEDAVFENEEIKIMYDFWCMNGSMNFSVFNKTDSGMYIDWKKSAFIVNDIAISYYEESSITQNVGFIRPIYPSQAIVVNKVVHQTRFSYIPPKSYIEVPNVYSFIRMDSFSHNNVGFGVSFNTNLTKDKTVKKVKIPSTKAAPVNSFVLKKEYQVQQTPFKFRNHVCYSKTETFTHTNIIDNEFYLKNEVQMNDILFYGGVYRPTQRPPASGVSINTINLNKINSPYKGSMKFYSSVRF